MILKGSQRSGSAQLAQHLLKTEENEHVEVFELRGFMANDLREALHEAYAVSRGTRCKQFLFSLSLNPPETAYVAEREFKAAIRQVEHALGLVGQPRAIVIHEKEGRRHAHCVWSRIDTDRMKAINLPHYKLRLRDVSRELYLQHGWKMPLGLVDSAERDPLNFTRAEWQQAMRTGHDPKALKALFQEYWAASDSRKAFAKALEARGFYLARGDRRGCVAVDFKGEVYALARYVGVRSKDVQDRLGDPNALPSIDTVKNEIAARMTPKIQRFVKEAEAAFQTQKASLAFAKAEMRAQQRATREALRRRHEKRWIAETNARAARLTKGLRGLWHWLTGRNRRIKRGNEREAYLAYQRDQREKAALIKRQLAERRQLQGEIVQAREKHAEDMLQLHRDVAHFMTLSAADSRPAEEMRRANTPSRSLQPHDHEQEPERPRHDRSGRSGGGRRRKRDHSPKPD